MVTALLAFDGKEIESFGSYLTNDKIRSQPRICRPTSLNTCQPTLPVYQSTNLLQSSDHLAAK